MRIIGFFLILILPNFLVAQIEREIVLNKSVHLFLEEKTNQNLIHRLNEYLTKPPNKTTLFYDQKLLENINNVLKMPEYGASFNWQLLNCVPYNNNLNQIKLSLIGQLGNGYIFCPISITLIAERQNDSFKIGSPFLFNVKHWKSEQIDNIQFFFQHTFNREEANQFAEHSKFLAKKLQLGLIQLDYYKCENIQEIYKLIGIDYSVKINGLSRGSQTYHNPNVFLSGTNKDEYSHDLTHFYFEKAIPDSIRNWTAEEGYNISITDYWGEPRDSIFTYLKEYISKNPKKSILDIFNSNDLIKEPIRARMPISALLIQKIEREHGFEKVLKIIRSGTKKEDFLDALNQIAEINENNFDDNVREELNL